MGRASSPSDAASPIASLAPRMWIAASTWCTIFMLLPAPIPPGTRYSLPGADISCSSARPLCSASSGAPAMMDSVPSAARLAPPETGQSTKRMSPRLRARSSAATDWA